MNNERIKKLESVAKELVTKFIFEEMADEVLEFGIITVTDIQISSDIWYMDIYVSSLKNPEWLTKALAKHAKHIQRKFNKSVSIRKFPRMRFRYDETWFIWEEVAKTLNKLDI